MRTAIRLGVRATERPRLSHHGTPRGQAGGHQTPLRFRPRPTTMPSPTKWTSNPGDTCRVESGMTTPAGVVQTARRFRRRRASRTQEEARPARTSLARSQPGPPVPPSKVPSKIPKTMSPPRLPLKVPPPRPLQRSPASPPLNAPPFMVLTLSAHRVRAGRPRHRSAQPVEHRSVELLKTQVREPSLPIGLRLGSTMASLIAGRAGRMTISLGVASVPKVSRCYRAAADDSRAGA